MSFVGATDTLQGTRRKSSVILKMYIVTLSDAVKYTIDLHLLWDWPPGIADMCSHNRSQILAGSLYVLGVSESEILET